MPDQERQLKAIVFSDVVDSSMEIFADELIAIQRIKEDLTEIRHELQRHGGSLVKSLGDGLLATFDGPTQALDFVQAAVQKLSERGRNALSHRFGLHTGEIYADGDDIVGQGVHLASRLQTVSPTNGVAFVRSTYDLISPRYRRLARPMGEVELKGLPEPMQVFSIGSQQLLHFVQSSGQGAFQLESLLEDTPFELVRPLGRSAAQRTLLLQEKKRERLAVMKLIPAGPELVEALKVEAACLDRLRHPRLPRVIDGFASSGFFCFLQEYIPGPSLNDSLDLLRRKQRLAELLRQVLQVLEQVHAAGLVHGDIHPANLIPAQEGGAFFLVDFSLLKSRVEAVSEQCNFSSAMLPEVGRPFFSAPERARFGRLTPSADLYALGVAALCLYTGQDPSTLYDETDGCWSLQGLEPEVAGWLAPLLEDLPSRRLQHAADALRLLDQPQTMAMAPAPAVAASSSVQPLGGLLGASVSKQLLQTYLVATYGPMVELLLDSQPSLIHSSQYSALQERLLAAGLAQADVEQAFRAAQVAEQPDLSLPEPQEQSKLLPAEPQLVSDAPVNGPELQVLRQAIGPIADLLWTAEMATCSDPGRLRQMLVDASVPEAAITAVLEQVAHSSEPSWRASEPNTPALASAANAMAVDAPVDGEQLLVQLIGPIGSMVWSQLAGLPEEDRSVALEITLRGYGLDEASLAALRRQLEGG